MYFPDFQQNSKFPWLILKFPDFSLTLNFPDFSLTSGNPEKLSYTLAWPDLSPAEAKPLHGRDQRYDISTSAPGF